MHQKHHAVAPPAVRNPLLTPNQPVLAQAEHALAQSNYRHLMLEGRLSTVTKSMDLNEELRKRVQAEFKDLAKVGSSSHLLQMIKN